MVLRSRTRLQLRRAVVTAALGALVVPATAGAAAKKPSVKTVTPKAASVGTKLTITGKNFRRGKGKNSVLFRRDNGKTLFVKADVSTTKKLTVVVPKTLEKYMLQTNGKPVPTRFRLKVLTTRLAKAFTAPNRSPVIAPERSSSGGGDASGGGGVPVAPLDPNADADADGLSNAFEQTVVKTDPTVADTDGDGVTDGYEY